PTSCTGDLERSSSRYFASRGQRPKPLQSTLETAAQRHTERAADLPSGVSDSGSDLEPILPLADIERNKATVSQTALTQLLTWADIRCFLTSPAILQVMRRPLSDRSGLRICGGQSSSQITGGSLGTSRHGRRLVPPPRIPSHCMLKPCADNGGHRVMDCGGH